MSFRDGRPPFDGGPPPPPPPGVEWGPDSFCEAVATCDLELVQALLGSCSVSAACVSTQPISTLSGHDFEANTPALHVGITLAAMHLSGDYDSELESSSRLTDFDSSLHADMIRALAVSGTCDFALPWLSPPRETAVVTYVPCSSKAQTGRRLMRAGGMSTRCFRT